MFKRHSLQVSVVKNQKPVTTEPAEAAPKTDHYAHAVVAMKEAAKVAAGALIVWKATDTACKMAMHIVATKIQP